MEPDFNDDLDENPYLSHRLDERHANNATPRRQVHNHTSAKLQ